MTGVDANPLYGIRASRARPPGLANDGERRAVYGTALTQFEELMAAATMASAQTRPLSLFYALSQAGRAIAAAHLPDDWRLRGHGLKVLNLDATDITQVKVAPNPGKAVDSFFGVAAAIGSEPLADSVALVELWSSLPRVCELIPEVDRKYRMPLGVSLLERHITRGHTDDWRWIRAAAAPLLPESLSDVERALAAYRHGRTASLSDVQGLKPIRAITEHGEGVELQWPNPDRDYLGQHMVLEKVAPTDPLTGAHWLRPELSDGASPSDLLVWWALLFALSMLARYEPAAWFRVLDYDGSAWAAPLGELLQIGVSTVPALVLAALYGSDPADPVT